MACCSSEAACRSRRSSRRHKRRDFQGLATERPLTKMREYVELLRTIVRAPLGAPVRYEGQIHRMHWEPRVQPVREAIPVYLAAIFPKMLKVAASVADGVALGVLFSAEYVRDVIRPSALEAAEAAGCDPAEVEFPMGALIAVDDDRERARATIRAVICSFFDPSRILTTSSSSANRGIRKSPMPA